MKMRIRLLSALACATAVFIQGTAFAHHGWAGNNEEEFELTGTVAKALSLDGPHATMKLKVGEQVWDLTLAPPARTERAGLKTNTIPVGAQVTIGGHRNKDPQKFEVKTERVTYNGKLYNVYPDRK